IPESIVCVLHRSSQRAVEPDSGPLEQIQSVFTDYPVQDHSGNTFGSGCSCDFAGRAASAGRSPSAAAQRTRGTILGWWKPARIAQRRRDFLLGNSYFPFPPAIASPYRNRPEQRRGLPHCEETDRAMLICGSDGFLLLPECPHQVL